MTDPKHRSAFLPIMLLVVGLVICLGIVLMFVPLVECGFCMGLGNFTYLEDLESKTGPGEGNGIIQRMDRVNALLEDTSYTCERCLGRTKTSLYQNWRKHPMKQKIWIDPDLTRSKWEKIRSLRQSTP